MSSKQERYQILDMIHKGILTAEEGARLFRALEDTSPGESGDQIDPDLESSPDSQAGSAQDTETSTGPGTVAQGEVVGAGLPDWRRWWMIPLWVGVGITVVGAGLMYWALQATGTGFWFACAWLPFLLGLAVILLAWSSRSARWLHLRIREQKGDRVQRVAISFPIPIRLTAWFLRTFGHYIPRLESTGIDEIILALEDNASPDTPFYLEVDEGDGEHVQIYIG